MISWDRSNNECSFCSRVFHSYRGITIAGKQLQNLGLCAAPQTTAFEQYLICQTCRDSVFAFSSKELIETKLIVSDSRYYTVPLVCVWQFLGSVWRHSFRRIRQGPWDKSAKPGKSPLPPPSPRGPMSAWKSDLGQRKLDAETREKKLLSNIFTA